ncbi:UNVERIFIED_CONTAM: putative folate-biopterin transporter 4 [Sesamum calycinum]|uniref:Folate-biopterin transporter 4 n=1 Tax=Sesamum calycinum TaxID=2727403 RepID=A0AAW2Q366_9LAMI
MILLTVQNLGSAMADVVIDAMIAEAVRSERASFAGDLQSISWMAMALGGICGSLFGGYALTNLPIHAIFLLFSALPAMQLLSCGLVEERPVGSEISSEYLTSNGGSHTINGRDFHEDGMSTEKSKRKISRRKRSHKSAKQGSITESQVNAVHGSLPTKWINSFKMTTVSLFRAFRHPIILRPMSWFFLAHVTVPNISTVMFYYQTEVLKLEASFLGTARVVGWFGLMLGTLTYNRYLKKMKLRRILLSNLSVGISDKVMMLFGSALSDGINQFKYVYAIPHPIRTALPAWHRRNVICTLMSINNLGSTVGSFVGAGLASILNISSGNFDNLLLAVIIQVLCTFFPITFLFLIPKEATGISA